MEQEKSQKMRIIINNTIGAVVLLLLTIFCGYASIYAGEMVIAPEGVVVFAFFIFPFLLLGGLYGYLISLIVFFLCFIATLILDMDSSYKMAIYLVAMLCFAFFGQYQLDSKTKFYIAET